MSTPIRPMKVEIHNVTREFNGFFKIDKLDTSHELYGGGMLRFSWLVFERGDAVAVVLYRKDTQEIVLVRQFRAPTLRHNKTGDNFTALNDGQLDETIAGMPRGRETHEECAIREVYEETGYKVPASRLERIAQFYASPGGTSERIFLFYAEVTEDDLDRKALEAGAIAGNKAEGENILVRHIPVSTFFAEMIDPDTTIDSKVLIASMLLRQRLQNKIPTSETQVAPPARHVWALARKPELQVVVRTGDMTSVKDVDAWINSENTDMEMDRFIGTSVSARIRYRGAAKDEQGRVVEDTIAHALRSAMRGRFTSNIGTVHDTTSGELLGTNNVKRIFHVATVSGVVNAGVRANEAHIEPVTRKALDAVERRNERWGTGKCTSALLPLIGTGDQGIAVEVAFPKIVSGILSYFGEQRSPVLTSVHISAYRQQDADYVLAFLHRHQDFVARQQ